jgi:hypothetical protein
MRLFLGMLLALAGLLMVYPLYAERQQAPCDALEQRTQRLVSGELAAAARREPRLQQLLTLVPGGMHTDLLARSYAQRTFPSLPPQLGCAIGYWYTMLNPDVARTLAMPGQP